jgi:hypothetical protein
MLVILALLTNFFGAFLNTFLMDLKSAWNSAFKLFYVKLALFYNFEAKNEQKTAKQNTKMYIVNVS